MQRHKEMIAQAETKKIKALEMNRLKNAVSLVGRMGIDPIVRTFENGTKLVKFSIATNETIREINGMKSLTQWHKIIAWGTNAELIGKFIKKGQLLAINGKLVNRSYKDKSGLNQRITEVQVREVLIISPKMAG